jgi:quinol monooxygenase YgiN
MSELLGIARLKIHPGKLDEFKHLAARCMELVRTKDTGTLQYELYFNSANTECLRPEGACSLDISRRLSRVKS